MKKRIIKFFDEFKTFVLRGNVMDLAVAVIIGAAFQSIIKSLVGDVISPFIGIFAKMDFSYLSFQINGVDIKYGSFLTEVINFVIMAFVIFLLIRIINKIMTIGKKEEPKPVTKKCIFCKTEIDIAATRCPNCTSMLEEAEKQAREQAELQAKKDAEILNEQESKPEPQQIMAIFSKVNPKKIKLNTSRQSKEQKDNDQEN